MDVVNIVVTIIAIIVGIAGIIAALSKKVITVSSKTKLYLNSNDKGKFVFDYSNNNGTFTIGSGDYVFDTKWSNASNTSIHGYKDNANIDSIALIEGVEDIEKITDFSCDFSSRVRTANVGDSILWKNVNGKYALTKVLSISAKSHGDDKNELECEYIVYK